ncbi:hypothetical protein PV08_10294 [Exophiala spinifera]|uniref:SnoaL-like domain-containing protein n=1 Tax=Exophiala spinifera TaxID=91928 RepID=A0A0D2AX56_9EURO|nr:uncharacterized protein PV08_10294 [Exophiala spinifera]KIW10995.1 hypothetical protein PV08_10294 [Exophiala spinifera]
MSTTQSVERATIQSWLEGFHRASAELNAEKWCTNFMTDDVELQYANNPVLKGEKVRDMFSRVFQQLDLMEHEIVYFDYVAPRIYQAARIRYRVKGDDACQDIEIPGFATFFVRKEPDGLLKCYRAETFLDPSQVFARIAQKSAEES